MKRLGGLFLLLAMLTLSGCKPTIPRGIMSEGKMERVLYDYHVAQAMGDDAGDSAEFKKAEYIDEAFRSNGITEAEFDSSMVWYLRHTERLYNIYDRLNKRLSKNAQALGGLVAQSKLYSDEGQMTDTADIWTGQQFYALSPLAFANRLTFTIKSDSSFHKADRFVWHFNVEFLFREGGKRAVAGLLVRYDNDSVVAATQRLFGNDVVQLSVVTDSVHAIREISGFVYMQDSEDGAQNGSFKAMFIEQPHLVRFRMAKPKPTATSTATDSAKKSPAGTTPASAPDTNRRQRMSPTQFRQSQPVEHKIDIVKEKAYRPVRRYSYRR